MYARVYVEITNICNLSCSFCHGCNRPPRRMSREEFSLVLDRLAGHTRYLYYHLMGEPLTHPELPEFLQMAAQWGYLSILTTNGTLLPTRGNALLECPVHKVNISVHSFENGTEEACFRYLSGIAAFAAEATRRGTIVCLRLWNRGHDGGRNEVILEQLHTLFPEPWTENTRGYRLGERLFLEWGDRFEWPDKNAPVQSESVYCYGLKNQFGILCDGTVVPCCLDSDGVISLGNIFLQDAQDILSSPRAKAMAEGFRRRTPTEDLCRRCGYAKKFD